VTVVVDTSVLIDHLRGHEAARAILRTADNAGERICASVLTKIEVLAGMRPAEEWATRTLLDSLEWVEVSDELAEQAGLLANRYQASFPGVDPVDYVVAATAMRLGAALWTDNIRHFPMFEGLQAPY